MAPDDPKAASQVKRHEDRPQAIVRNLAEAREERQPARKSTYLDVSWPDPPYGISDRGYEDYREEVGEYIQNLMNAARTIARDANLESISSIHIKEAVKLFSNRPQTRRSKVFEIAGGLLAGASVSFMVSGDFFSKPIPIQIAIYVAGIAGALMIGMSLRRS